MAVCLKDKTLPDVINYFRDRRKHNIPPIGERNGVNLEYEIPGGKSFVEGSLVVKVDGSDLTPDVDYVMSVDRKKFTIITSMNDHTLRKKPIQSDEDLLIDYTLEP